MTADSRGPGGLRNRPERQASARALRALRRVRGLNQAGWAVALGSTLRVIQRWESGDAVPDAAFEATLTAYGRNHNLFGRLPAGEPASSPESLQAILARARAAGDAPAHEELTDASSQGALPVDDGSPRPTDDRRTKSEQPAGGASSDGWQLPRSSLIAAILAAVTLLAALLIVRYVEPPKPCVPNSRFVEDVNVPDGEVMRPGTAFEKEWRLVNPDADNLCRWSRGFNVVWSGGPNLATGSSFDIPEAGRGDQVVIRVPMVAPQQPGEYRSEWILRTPDGRKFGDPFWVQIVVRE